LLSGALSTSEKHEKLWSCGRDVSWCRQIPKLRRKKLYLLDRVSYFNLYKLHKSFSPSITGNLGRRPTVTKKKENPCHSSGGSFLSVIECKTYTKHTLQMSLLLNECTIFIFFQNEILYVSYIIQIFSDAFLQIEW
jgi:hypothetical protein